MTWPSSSTATTRTTPVVVLVIEEIDDHRLGARVLLCRQHRDAAGRGARAARWDEILPGSIAKNHHLLGRTVA
jgi:hypothetical protein